MDASSEPVQGVVLFVLDLNAGLDLSTQNPGAKFSRVNCFPNVGQSL